MIPVTKPFLPPKEEFIEYLNGIWERNYLTNNGPLVNELELQLKKFLNLDHLLFVSNGTIALQLAIKALSLKGEIITTPFSYVATTSSIIWEGCKPIFVDINAADYTINSELIEKLITSDTTAILATHVYGNPCNIMAIERIAKKHNIKVIYDAAHSFYVNYKGKSVFSYGDISTTSFHATKLFHTTEGGATITNSPDLLKRMAYHRNFGHDGPSKYNGIGINGKNSEIHAAMGLCNLKYINKIIEKRKRIIERYEYWMEKIPVQLQLWREGATKNYAYFPVLFESEELCMKVFNSLEKKNIFARRYFHPILNKLDYILEEFKTPVAEDISRRILCLPVYYQLSIEEVDTISRFIIRTIKY